jgi:2-polyprenyl-6-methoxyphenol hydroxylase-like FAD-dependent oxidoreductase
MTEKPDVKRRGHAVVIGGSMAGLLAARVLSDRFEEVTIIERDRLPEEIENRKGVPQGHHVHGLLPRGHMALERLFPGLSGELVSRGAILGDVPAESRWYQPGGYRVRFETGRKGLLMSRPLLEAGVRRRVTSLPNVALLEEHAVTGLLLDGTKGRVNGVTVERRAEGAQGETLAADLVVDAGGRGSRAPAWLEEMGYERAPEERIEIGVSYTTRLYRRRPDDLPGVKLVLVQSTPPGNRRFGAMFRVEDGRWMVTLGGYLGERAPADEEGFVEFARGLPAPEIHDTIKDAQPLGEAARYNFPANLRRRYERLSRFPEGYLVTGDALCSFNPIYGQGMSVAALEAATLEECLSEGLEDLPRRFYRSVSKVVDTPWRLAAGADFAQPGVTGSRGPATGVINWYVGQVQRAATRDEVVCRALVLVTGLIAPPETLFHPKIALRVLRQAAVRRARDGAKASSGRPLPNAA